MRKQYSIGPYHGVIALAWNGLMLSVSKGFTLLFLGLFFIEILGITVSIKKEEVRWNWPWTRLRGLPWYDITIACNFETLEARRIWWDNYHHSWRNTL